MTKKDAAHRAEMEARAKRRAERAARSDAVGPTPRNIGAKRTSTDVEVVKAAYDKRKRKAEARLENAARTREGRTR